MNTLTEDSLILQRDKLRLQLQEQRNQITRQLLPMPGENNIYPRSMTMRLLTQRPALVTALLSDLMTMLVGARLYRLLSSLLVLVKILKSTAIGRQKQLTSRL